MLEVAIVGGGLCGLALAHSLQSRGRDWRLYEARERLGGRVSTGHGRNGAPVDLGATWFWPETQPGIARLVEDLGLRSFAQHDDGRVLHLSDPNHDPKTVALTPSFAPAEDESTPATPGAVHGGARRIEGGAAAIVQALARPLPAERLRSGHAVEAVIDHGDFIELRLRHGESQLSVQARQVVLALPPRVIVASLRFVPALPEALQQVLNATPTWMATAAKAGLVYDHAFWRDAGHTGNAWVTHAQAMLAEVFDACGPEGSSTAALAGFVALGAAQREQFKRGRDLLLESQAVMLYGAKAANPDLLWQDWAEAPETCTPADIAEEAMGGTGQHPQYGDPALAEPLWEGRLYFGGSETARHGGGYMEGALGAAARLRRQLAQGVADLRPQEAANESAMVDAQNDEHLSRYAAWVQGERQQAVARYQTRVHQVLSSNGDDQLTQRAVLGALESLYEDALQQLQQLPLAVAHLPVEQGRVALTPRVLEPFKGLADELLAAAVIHNRTSCALSNFPNEHKPGGDYLRTIRRDLAAAWQSFALNANACLLAKAGT